MNDDDLDQLVAQASPVRPGRSAELDLAKAKAELLQEILDTEARPRRITRLRVTVAGVAAAAVLVVAIVGGRPGRDAPDRPPSDDVQIAVSDDVMTWAESTPRVLLDLPGWSLERVYVRSATSADVVYRKDDLLVYVTVENPSFQPVEAMGLGYDVMSQVTVLGRPATLVEHPDRSFTVVFPPDGPTYLTIASFEDSGGRDAIGEILGAMRSVGVEEWLDALPATVVRPDQRAAAVDDLLVGTLVPHGLDLDPLGASRPTGGDRGVLALQVAEYVACAWGQEWIAAANAGDDAAVDEASDALTSWSTWRSVRVASEVELGPGTHIDPGTGILRLRDNLGQGQGLDPMCQGVTEERAILPSALDPVP